jgi:hypothetical protein
MLLRLFERALICGSGGQDSEGIAAAVEFRRGRRADLALPRRSAESITVRQRLGAASVRNALAGVVILILATGGLSGCRAYHQIRAVSLRVPWQGYSKLVVRMVDGSLDITSGMSSAAEISAKLSARGNTPGEAKKKLDQLELVAAPDSADPTALLVWLEYPPDCRWSPGADVSIRVPVACDAGNIRATLPATMPGVFEAHATRGNLDVNFGSAAVQGLLRGPDFLRARLNGGGAQINASTCGSVTINFVD